MPTIYVDTSKYPNPFTFVTNRNNQKIANAIIRGNPDGLTGEGAQQAIDRQDYTTMLQKIWGERDRTARLDWLRGKTYTPFAISERGFAELKADPTAQTLYRVALPLLFFDQIRIRMDRKCSNDPSIAGNQEVATRAYFMSLRTLASKHNLALEMSGEKLLDFHKEELALCKQLERDLEENPDILSSPEWLQDFGVGGFLRAFKRADGVPSEEASISMKPKEDWHTIRLNTLRTEINQLEKAIGSFADGTRG